MSIIETLRLMRQIAEDELARTAGDEVAEDRLLAMARAVFQGNTSGDAKMTLFGAASEAEGNLRRQRELMASIVDDCTTLIARAESLEGGL